MDYQLPSLMEFFHLHQSCLIHNCFSLGIPQSHNYLLHMPNEGQF